MPAQAIPYILILGFMFGSTLTASRFSVGQFQPTTYIGLRLSLAGLAHLALYAAGNGRLAKGRFRWPRDRRLWAHAALVGVVGTAVPMTAIVTALQYLSSGIASILITANPAVTVVLAHFMLDDERLTWRKTMGVVLALSGTVLLAFSGESGLPDVSEANPLGYWLMLVAVLCGAGTAVYVRKYMQSYNAFDVSSVRMFTSALVVMPLSLLLIGFNLQAVTGSGYLALGYAAVMGTFGAFLLSIYNIQRFGATAAAMTAYIVPLVASVGGVLFLGEHITWVMVGGMGLIVAGIAIIRS